MGVENGPGPEKESKKISEPIPTDYQKIPYPSGAKPPEDELPEGTDIETLEKEVEESRQNFLELAKDYNWSTEIIRDVIELYHGYLYDLAVSKYPDDVQAFCIWFCEEQLKTYQEAAKINSSYQSLVESAENELEHVRNSGPDRLSDPNLS